MKLRQFFLKQGCLSDAETVHTDKMFVDHRVIVWKHQNAFPGGDVVDLKSITGKGIEFKEQLKDYELQEEL